MPRVCTVCRHDERREIDRQLVSRAFSYRDIARQFGVSKDAVSRHVKEHLPELLTRAHEAEQLAEADKLLTDIRKIQVQTLLMLQGAEKSGDLRTALAAVREARNNVTLLAELRGQLDRRPQINLVLSPEWLELRTLIVGALEPHPDAREAVVQAIASRKGDGSS
jgi:predicted transcriptional regulator